MSTRFFGEYLVRKGVITPSALVSALLEQMGRLPPVAQIVFDHKWLSAEQLMKIFHQQQETGEDFTLACRTLGFWHEELARNLDEAIKKDRIPLGQILVQRGDIDLKTLTKSLDDFLAQAEIHVDSKPSPAPIEAPVNGIEPIVLSEPIKVPVERLEPVTTASLDSGIVSEIQEMFDERKRRAVKVAMGFIKDKNPPDESMMTKLMQDSLKITRTILGLLKIYNVEGLQSLFLEIERSLDARMYASLFPLDEMQKAAEVITEAIDEAWALRDSLIRNGNEDTYMKENTGERYGKVLARLREIQ